MGGGWFSTTTTKSFINCPNTASTKAVAQSIRLTVAYFYITTSQCQHKHTYCRESYSVFLFSKWQHVLHGRCVLCVDGDVSKWVSGFFDFREVCWHAVRSRPDGWWLCSKKASAVVRQAGWQIVGDATSVLPPCILRLPFLSILGDWILVLVVAQMVDWLWIYSLISHMNYVILSRELLIAVTGS